MSTDYTNSPSCKLLATYCAICGLPLSDARSVERGIGPQCADKYGLDQDPAGPADWKAAEAALCQKARDEQAVHLARHGGAKGSHGTLPLIMDPGKPYLARDFWGIDARAAVNSLVHRVACEHGSDFAIACVKAIALLGYPTVAVACATHRSSPLKEKIATVTVENRVVDGRKSLVVNAPYEIGQHAAGGFNRIVRNYCETYFRPIEKDRIVFFRQGQNTRLRLWTAISEAFVAGTLVVEVDGNGELTGKSKVVGTPVVYTQAKAKEDREDHEADPNYDPGDYDDDELMDGQPRDYGDL